MSIFKNIATFFLGAVFLLTSTGIVIFETNCCCSESEKLSLYISPESCHENEKAQKVLATIDEWSAGETNCEECCNSEKRDCDCAGPEMKYIKLVNHLINDEVKFVKLKVLSYTLAKQNDFCLQLTSENQNEEDTDFYSNPPPQIKSTLDFLIQIQQLKIPFSA
ncbi:hypothetical protein GM418_25280 [Maribellus comscasis]|uniref:Uncharacterized protein n=1 Tax=Maribellus comscasis TaxID=2681766 RepID=A0A6I6K084_9BACT|nr:hypothetical protein [Maribellus comscasis]QGY46850.1 hypothetical protein GM418_25280 [Maribellus comscasis]